MAINGNNNNANELGNPFTAAGVSGSSLSGGSFPTAYGFAKKFVNAKSNYGSGTNGLTSIDDPTYLGFELMFDISSPLFNGTVTGDPGIEDGGSSNEYPSTPSAIGYLNKIGQANRVEFLKSFCQGILEIQRTRPYYFQTIAGLVEAFQKSTDFSEDPFTGSKGDEGIAIGCLEALDLKITALFNMYRMAVYDMRYKRFVIPKNLCRFDVYINVHEIRKFKSAVADAQTYGAVGGGGDIRSAQAGDTAAVTNENTSQIRFKFTECLFDVSASGKVFEGVTNTGGEIATTEMKFGYSTLELISQYAGFDSAMEEDKQQTIESPGMQGKQKSFLKNKLDQVVAKAEGIGNQALTNLKNSPERLQAAIEGRIGGLIDSAVLGNVFGLQNQILGALTNPGIINAALGSAIQSGFGNGNPPAKGIQSSIGDNALGEAVNVANTLTGDQSAFDPSTNTLGGLDAANVFGPSGPGPNSTLTENNVFD